MNDTCFVAYCFRVNTRVSRRKSAGALHLLVSPCQEQGIVATGLAWSLKIWCINKGGPLFIAVFQPLQTVMVAILAAIFLGDQLYTGGVIGAAIIVIGLYSVLWTKSMEKKGACDLETETRLARHFVDEEGTRENP